jgi:hypothetical protein
MTGRGVPAPALMLGITRGVLPPPWFVAVEAPACGAVAEVPAEATTDGRARRFVCDRPADHDAVRHRQVTDNDSGETIVWETAS